MCPMSHENKIVKSEKSKILKKGKQFSRDMADSYMYLSTKFGVNLLHAFWDGQTMTT